MAAAPAPTFPDIRKALKARRFAPVYLLHGAEGYFIDELVKDFDSILSDDEKVFNQYTLFAPETEPGQVLDVCRRIPMMAEHQVVILKEAQAVRADKLAKLIPYLSSPTPTTILVVCVRGADAKKDIEKAVVKGGGVVFYSKKVSDYNIPAVIGTYIREKGLSAEQKALEMLRDFVGNDLSRLYNEIDKLATLLPPRAAVTPEVIELNIGVSKEYNTYELVDALAARNAERAFRIAAYFRANPKAAPLVMVAASIFAFFADLLVAYYAADKSDKGLTDELGLRNNFALKRVRLGMSRYNAFQIIEIIGAIRRFDINSKGVLSRQNEHQLFHELIHHILTAPGRI
ncbi:MAG: DNA polymerase III subunit delta [Bacteroidales bacterium]|nr:DNA polymerase III subunit delta [Bacteroidales bacterium]MBD5219550.1 DNA polymerase III subunit delta [Bacteroidales bacterium]MDE6436726.1 DNA polymerase III subunit delta [Muribaculaceae bacterium]